jgi:hypothetical protein
METVEEKEESPSISRRRERNMKRNQVAEERGDTIWVGVVIAGEMEAVQGEITVGDLR